MDDHQSAPPPEPLYRVSLAEWSLNKPLFDGEGSYSVGCISIDPNDSLVVWVGSGENNSSRSSYGGMGMFRPDAEVGRSHESHKSTLCSDRCEAAIAASAQRVVGALIKRHEEEHAECDECEYQDVCDEREHEVAS